MCISQVKAALVEKEAMVKSSWFGRTGRDDCAWFGEPVGAERSSEAFFPLHFLKHVFPAYSPETAGKKMLCEKGPSSSVTS